MNKIIITAAVGMLVGCGGGGGGGSSSSGASVNTGGVAARTISCSAADGTRGCWQAVNCEPGFSDNEQRYFKTAIAFQDNGNVDLGTYVYSDPTCSSFIEFQALWAVSEAQFSTNDPVYANNDALLTSYRLQDDVLLSSGLTGTQIVFQNDLDGKVFTPYYSLFNQVTDNSLCFTDPSFDISLFAEDAFEFGEDENNSQIGLGLQFDKCLQRNFNDSLNTPDQ